MDISNWRRFGRHSMSEVFPDMSECEFESLLADMKQHGYDNKQPVWLYEGKVLDGWHRQRAGVMNDKMPTYENFKGDVDEARDFVIRRNLSRRHLDTSQRALVAGKLSRNSHGGDRKSADQVTKLSLENIAKTLEIHKNSAHAGAKVVQEGAKDLQDAVSDGTVKIHDAAAIVDKPKSVQRKAVKSVKSGESKTVREAVSKFDDDSEADNDPTIDDEIKLKNSMIESFCRLVMKTVEDNMPSDIWLDDMDRKGAALQKFKDACGTMRTAKCHAACPKCDGDGCSKCKQSGRVPRLVYDQLV